MRKLIATIIVTLLTSGAFAESQKMTCALTGKEVKTCCCEGRPNGKMFCKLAKKEIDKCCGRGM